MSKTELFIEILVEELPAIPFLREFKNFDSKWREVLQEFDIAVESKFFYTPRRIVIACDNFPLVTQDKVVELYGPPVQVAYKNGDKTAELTPAGEAFLKKNNLTIESLQFSQKQGKEVLFATSVEKGVQTKQIITLAVQKFLGSLHFGKHMRWGEVKEDFIRPIRNIVIFMGQDFIEMEVYGIKTRAQTQLHRDFGFEWVCVNDFRDYQEKLKNGGVILSQDERRALILEHINQTQKENNLFVEIDRELLDEVVAITEYPQVILGGFEEKFLTLPKEVIITSMKENQRYFAVYQDDKMQKLSNHFIVVSNTTNKVVDIIRLGNEKVLKARLEDAMFFYNNDLKRGLNNQGLENVIFIDGAGSMLDKVEREKKIAELLIKKFGGKLFDYEKVVLQAIELSKADLLSEMVYEFSNLQGLMGYYYALAMGLHSDIALCIKEQYLPMGEDSALPSTGFSSIAALAHKLDNIFTLFSVGKIPTGSKDPFALRRAAAGILRIVLQEEFVFDLKSDLVEIVDLIGYKNIDINKIVAFFTERIDGILSLNPVFLKSVLATNEYDVCEIIAKARALDEVLSSNQDALIATFKRIANFLKTEVELKKIREDLLIEQAEKDLYNNYQQIARQDFSNYVEKIKNLCGLKSSLDLFFDNVMVNVEEEELKSNRVQLIAHIYKDFLSIADIKEIGFIK